MAPYSGYRLMFSIVEDHSPYYVTFTYPGIEEYLLLLRNTANSLEFVKPVNKRAGILEDLGISYLVEEARLIDEDRCKLIFDNPCHKLFELEKTASFLTTLPGGKSPVHYDTYGKTNDRVPFRINYPVFIHDDKTITSWYDESYIKPLDEMNEIADTNNSHKIKKYSMCMSNNHAVLFNPTMYHDWDNSTSTNNRTTLGSRPTQEFSHITFDDAKRLLFGVDQ